MDLGNQKNAKQDNKMSLEEEIRQKVQYPVGRAFKESN